MSNPPKSTPFDRLQWHGPELCLFGLVVGTVANSGGPIVPDPWKAEIHTKGGPSIIGWFDSEAEAKTAVTNEAHGVMNDD